MAFNHPEAVYIMTSRPRGALYVGRTKCLVGRVEQHRTGGMAGHTSKYKIRNLVYYEWHEGWQAAWAREQQLKRYRREWKFNLIEAGNPGWKDLWFEIIEDDGIPFLPR